MVISRRHLFFIFYKFGQNFCGIKFFDRALLAASDDNVDVECTI